MNATRPAAPDLNGDIQFVTWKFTNYFKDAAGFWWMETGDIDIPGPDLPVTDPAVIESLESATHATKETIQ